MIIKNLFVQCPIDSIVTELMLLYRADESRRGKFTESIMHCWISSFLM